MDIKEIFSAIEKHLVPRDKRTIDDEEAIYGVFPKIDQTVEERKKIVEDKKKIIESDSPWDAIPMAPQQFIPLLKNIGIFAGGAAAIDQGIKKIQEHPEVAKAAGLSAGMMLATMALMNRGKGSVKISPVLQKEAGNIGPRKVIDTFQEKREKQLQAEEDLETAAIRRELEANDVDTALTYLKDIVAPWVKTIQPLAEKARKAEGMILNGPALDTQWALHRVDDIVKNINLYNESPTLAHVNSKYLIDTIGKEVKDILSQRVDAMINTRNSLNMRSKYDRELAKQLDEIIPKASVIKMKGFVDPAAVPFMASSAAAITGSLTEDDSDILKAAGISGMALSALMLATNKGKGSTKISPILKKEAGAFRPDDSLLLRSSRDALQNEIEGNKGYLVLDLEDNVKNIEHVQQRLIEEPRLSRYWTEQLSALQVKQRKLQDQLDIYNRLSPKQIDQYGTTKFSLDPALEHVRNPQEFKVSIYDFTVPEVQNDILSSFKQLSAGRRIDPETFKSLNADEIKAKFGKTSEFQDILQYYYNYIQTVKNPNKTFYDVNTYTANEDIHLGIQDLLKTFEQSGVRIQDFEKKPLDAIVQKYLGIKKDLLKQDAEVLKNISARTEQLRKTQNIPFEGIVRIDDPVERAADTWVLNICLGSYSNPSGKKYLAAYHPATGQPMDSPEQLNKGFWKIYQDRVNKKAAELYSYRPNGIPELAIDWSPIEGIPVEIRGINNADPTKEQLEKIRPFIMDLKTKWKRMNPGKKIYYDKYFPGTQAEVDKTWDDFFAGEWIPEQ